MVAILAILRMGLLVKNVILNAKPVIQVPVNVYYVLIILGKLPQPVLAKLDFLNRVLVLVDSVTINAKNVIYLLYNAQNVLIVPEKGVNAYVKVDIIIIIWILYVNLVNTLVKIALLLLIVYHVVLF